MMRVRATLKLYKGPNKRQTPFLSGYRPLFQFSDMKTSGSISICNAEQVFPGEESVVIITFLNEVYLTEQLITGATSFFYEGSEPLGEIVIIEC